MTTIAARPTIYKGIKMRSRLEGRVAAALDRKGIDWGYEGPAFGNEDRIYLPDFVLDYCDGDVHRLVYLEVKGIVRTAGELRLFQRRMEVIWESIEDAVLMIWEDLPQRRIWLATQATGWVGGEMEEMVEECKGAVR